MAGFPDEIWKNSMSDIYWKSEWPHFQSLGLLVECRKVREKVLKAGIENLKNYPPEQSGGFFFYNQGSLVVKLMRGGFWGFYETAYL